MFNIFGGFDNFDDFFGDSFKSFDEMQSSFEERMKNAPKLNPGQSETTETVDKDGTVTRTEYSMSENGTLSVRTFTSRRIGKEIAEEDPSMKLKRLEADLLKAKESENYEECVKLRDEIKKLKS